MAVRAVTVSVGPNIHETLGRGGTVTIGRQGSSLYGTAAEYSLRGGKDLGRAENLLHAVRKSDLISQLPKKPFLAVLRQGEVERRMQNWRQATLSPSGINHLAAGDSNDLSQIALVVRHNTDAMLQLVNTGAADIAHAGGVIRPGEELSMDPDKLVNGYNLTLSNGTVVTLRGLRK